jgi:hypothetical protein
VTKPVYRIFILILLTLIFFRCSDPPKSIGIELLEDGLIDAAKINSLDDSLYQSSTYFKKVANLGTAERLLLGKYSNAEASLLLQFRFNLADSVKEDLLNNNLNVTYAAMEMYQDYSFGDSLGAFDFTLHKVNSYWSIDFNVDSLSQLDLESDDLSGDKTINDSVTIVNINNQLVQSWLLAEADENAPRNNGIYLKPTGETNRVRGYQALTISFIDMPVLKLVLEKPGVYVDTITYSVNIDVGIVKGDLPVVSPENFVVQGGLIINAKLFFDVSKIPSTAIINSAELVLTLDTTQTVLGPDAIESVQAVYMLDSTNTDSLSTLTATLSRSGDKLRGNVTTFIYRWFTESNHGLLIRAFDQLKTLEMYAIKGSNSTDPAFKPYLEITYTNFK